jgi:hypothetical protein
MIGSGQDDSPKLFEAEHFAHAYRLLGSAITLPDYARPGYGFVISTLRYSPIF